MSLFADGVIATIDDLRGYETSILEAAYSEGIDLTRKLGLAQEEIAVELEAALLGMEGGKWRTGSGRPALGKVVVTTPLKQWHIFHTLALAYRDAYNSQLNDRYMGKWKEYAQLAKWAARMLRETGVGLVSVPIPKAAAPELDVTAGNGAAARYYVQVAWRDEGGAEGAPSDACVFDVPDGGLLVVEAGNAPSGAAGWSIYAGTSDNEILLQSEGPIGAGERWTAPETGLGRGRKPGTGQEAEYFVTVERVLRRG